MLVQFLFYKVSNKQTDGRTDSSIIILIIIVLNYKHTVMYNLSHKFPSLYVLKEQFVNVALLSG